MSRPAKPIIGYHDGEAVVFEHAAIASARVGCSIATIRKILVEDIEYNGWTLDYKYTDDEINMIKESETKPFEFTLHKIDGQLQLTLRFNVELDGSECHGDCKFHEVSLPLGVMDYGNIVSAVFNDVYTNNQFQAIMANHALDPEDEEHEAEFRQMQEFRKLAKQYAKDVIAEIEAIDDIDEYLKKHSQ